MSLRYDRKTELHRVSCRRCGAPWMLAPSEYEKERKRGGFLCQCGQWVTIGNEREGAMSKLRKFTIDDIRGWDPCYDPSWHLPEDWSGTAIDILHNDKIPPQDRIWVVCRKDIIDDRTLRLFAVWCARQVQHLMTDARSVAALDVAERYAHGEATSEELAAAWEAARAAARAANSAAAWAAVCTAYCVANWAAQCKQLATMVREAERDE